MQNSPENLNRLPRLFNSNSKGRKSLKKTRPNTPRKVLEIIRGMANKSGKNTNKDENNGESPRQIVVSPRDLPKVSYIVTMDENGTNKGNSNIDNNSEEDGARFSLIPSPPSSSFKSPTSSLNYLTNSNLRYIRKCIEFNTKLRHSDRTPRVGDCIPLSHFKKIVIENESQASGGNLYRTNLSPNGKNPDNSGGSGNNTDVICAASTLDYEVPSVASSGLMRKTRNISRFGENFENRTKLINIDYVDDKFVVVQDEVVEMRIANSHQGESTLGAPLLYLAPEDFHCPIVKDVRTSVGISVALSALLKSQFSLPEHWTGESIGTERDHTHLAALKDAKMRAEAAKRQPNAADKEAQAHIILGILNFNTRNYVTAVVHFSTAAVCFQRMATKGKEGEDFGNASVFWDKLPSLSPQRFKRESGGGRTGVRRSDGDNRKIYDFYTFASNYNKDCLTSGYNNKVRGLAFCLNMLGVSYYHNFQYDEAISVFKSMDPLCGTYGKAVANVNCGVSFSALGDLQSALNHFDTAIKLAATLKDPLLEASAYGNKGIGLMRLCCSSYSVFNKNKTNARIAKDNKNITMTTKSTENEEDDFLGKIEQSRAALEHALFLYDLTNDQTSTAVCFLLLGELFTMSYLYLQNRPQIALNSLSIKESEKSDRKVNGREMDNFNRTNDDVVYTNSPSKRKNYLLQQAIGNIEQAYDLSEKLECSYLSSIARVNLGVVRSYL